MVIKRFAPYTLEDLSIIIRHSSGFPKRWEWFWPRFTAVTPGVVLENTVVAYHNRHGEEHVIPASVLAVEEMGQVCIFHDPRVNLTGPTLQALQLCQTRIIARVDDDVKLKPEWARDVISKFNVEPHLKMLGRFVACGPSYGRIKEKLYAPWLHELLMQVGDYRWEFLAGAMLVANRVLWLGYYPFIDQYHSGRGEDSFFTLVARADGVQVKSIDKYYGHWGQRQGNGIKQEGY